MINPWEVTSGVFTLIFLLASFYFVAVSGIRDHGKRGTLILVAVALIGPAFLLDLISEVYEIKSAEILGHSIIILTGILMFLSFYLSKKELERGRAPS